MNAEKTWEDGDVGKRIGNNLRQFRSNKGISLEALANQIGVSKLTLINIERGEANPTLSVILENLKWFKYPDYCFIVYRS